MTTQVAADFDICTVEARGLRFGMAVPTDATFDTDPVAYAYKVNHTEHLARLLDVALAVLRPGDAVLDLGAHLGGFALTAAACGCRVLAVEASPRNAALLRESVRFNRFDSMQVIHAAVSDSPGTLEFIADGPYGHLATPGTDRPVVKVPAVTVDDLLAEHRWTRVRFVKLDIEGSEVAAVRGMSRLLAGRSAPPVFFESNTHTLGFFGKTAADLKGEFRRRGFSLYDVSQPGRLTLATGDDQPEVVMDFLAAKRLPRPLWAIAPEYRPGLLERLLG